MKKVRYHFVLGFIFAGLLLVSSCKRNVFIQFNFPSEEVFLYTIEDHQKATVLGNSVDYSMLLSGSYIRTRNTTSLKTIVNRVQVTYKVGDSNRLFDSKLGDTPAASESAVSGIFELVGQPFYLQPEDHGKLNEIQLSGIGNKEDSFLIFQLFEPFFDFYPSAPVAVGAQWQSQRTMMVQNVTGHLKTNYTLKSVKQDTAIIKTKAVLELPNQEIVRNKLKTQVGMIGEQTGTLTVLLSQGRLLHTVLRTRTKTIYQIEGLKTESLIDGITTLTSQTEI